MAFDAGMVACLCDSLNKALSGAKVEKVTQPSGDEIVLSMRSPEGNSRLLISCASGSARAVMTEGKYENPLVAPMFCMLLRKHLSGARIRSVTQPGFERILFFTFDAYDELGFPCEKYIVLELIGKFSNIIFLNEKKKIVSAVRTVDFSSSAERQVLPGLTYELPPTQDKRDPRTETREGFLSLLSGSELRADKFIVGSYLGISPLVAREMVYSAHRSMELTCRECDGEKLWYYFDRTMERIRTCDYAPTIITEKNGRPVEYSFLPINQYGLNYISEEIETPSALLERFFSEKSTQDRLKARSADILRLLTNASTRLQRKIALQTEELAQCESMDKYKLYGDLLTANMYALKRGDTSVRLVNYYSEDCEEIEIPLDGRLAPSANAQRYYKRYNKAKTAKKELTHQIEIAKSDLEYVDTVFDSLCRAQTVADLEEIREELYTAGFASRMKGYEKKKRKVQPPLQYTTTDGMRVLCGRNNTQNDQLTFKTAYKGDYWFHVKGAPGSHVILCTEGIEPTDRDFTEAAMIAAANSKLADGDNVGVDYTLAKNVKKPAGAKPGYVIYHTNWTAYVSPDKNHVERLKS